MQHSVERDRMDEDDRSIEPHGREPRGKSKVSCRLPMYMGPQDVHDVDHLVIHGPGACQ